jgi:streptomycin 6-kinase
MTHHQPPPEVDEAVRRRLTARFGDEIQSWLDRLPPVLIALADRWQLEFGLFIPDGSMSAVIRCQMCDGRPAVLKLCPDGARLANEAAALAGWATVHVPSVFAVDQSLGALLIEAIEPGTSLTASQAYPSGHSIAELMNSLHTHEVPGLSFPSVSQRIEYLFESWERARRLRAEWVQIVPAELFERGRRLAIGLANDASPTVLLHGDLTPRNILDGGNQRGLVAIDPAPCLGDATFDAVDLLLWQADSAEAIVKRAELLAAATGLNANRLVDWCTAFAGMVAEEVVVAVGTSSKHIQTLLTLATQA